MYFLLKLILSKILTEGMTIRVPSLLPACQLARVSQYEIELEITANYTQVRPLTS